MNALEAFGSTPVKQSKVDYVKSPEKEEVAPKKRGKKGKKVETEVGIHQDSDFEKTLLDLDDDLLNENLDALDETVEEALHHVDKKKKVNAVEEEEKLPELDDVKKKVNKEKNDVVEIVSSGDEEVVNKDVNRVKSIKEPHHSKHYEKLDKEHREDKKHNGTQRRKSSRSPDGIL